MSRWGRARPGSPPGRPIHRGPGRRKGALGRLGAALLAAGALLAATQACAPPDSGRPDLEMRAFVRLGAAEDARPAGGPDLETLRAGTRAPTPFLRRVAVRGLGRLENPDLLEDVAPLLEDPDPGVRAQAADALAQALHGVDGAPALSLLVARVGAEEDDGAAAAVARSLGRLRLDGAEAGAAARALLALSREGGGDAPPRRMVGVALGMESLARRLGTDGAGPTLRPRLAELTTYRGGGEAGARVRTLAFLALAATGGTDPARVEAGLRDPDTAVRRAAALDLAASDPAPGSPAVGRVLADPAPRVRLEGIRILGARPATEVSCALLLDATEDPAPPVQLLALDALGAPCPARAAQVSRLASLAASLDPADPLGWHAPAHALRSLAAVDPAAARPLLPRFLAHDNPFARAWAARAAGTLGEVGALRALIRDPDDNVLTAALPALSRLQGGAADDILLAALTEREDPQLVLTAADLLQETERPGPAGDAAFVGLAHLSRDGMETHRDARMALLDLVDAVGDSTRVSELEPYIRDYDPEIARRAAEILLRWTGQRWIASPRGPDRLPFPTARDVRAMQRSSVVLHMARGGAIQIRLLPTAAPTNAFRLWRLAGSGVLDGLTLHRVVPNFVVQGGSPGGNEYAGHGAYTRDEVGLVTQWRGTVGLSTRGRDTGDGQIYVNLEDNVRLDHDYTVLGEVVAGMEVVGAVREGDVIRRAEILPDEDAPGA